MVLRLITVSVWMIAVLLTLAFTLLILVKFFGCLLKMEQINSKSDKIQSEMIEESKHDGNAGALSISQIETDFFSKLRAEIKEGFSESLDYSLLEDQVLPEMYESSPDVEVKRKRTSVGLSNLLRNMTIYDNNNWEEDISDESFVRTEKLIRGSEYKLVPKNKIIDISTDDDNINDSLDSVKEVNDIVSIEDDISSDVNKIINQDTSSDLHINPLNVINEETETQSNNSSGVSVDDSLNSIIAKIPNDKSSYTVDNEDFDESLKDSDNDTLKFNDTIEEMEHFLKYGSKQMAKKPEPITKINTTPKKSPVKLSKEITNNYAELPLHINSPISCSPKVITNRRILTPGRIPTPHKIPIKKNLTPKSTDPRTPMQRYAFLNNRLDKFNNVISPVGYYINNSPNVPMMKNVSPAKNYWDRPPPKNFNSKLKIPKANFGKENIALPEKAYKSPKVTNVIDKPSIKHLPKNKGVVAMTEKLPKVVVIKHMKRDEKTILRQSNNANNIIDDSFAHLPVNSMDVSHCVGHQAGRYRTLK